MEIGIFERRICGNPNNYDNHREVRIRIRSSEKQQISSAQPPRAQANDLVYCILENGERDVQPSLWSDDTYIQPLNFNSQL